MKPLLLTLAAFAATTAHAQPQANPFVFRDVAKESGLLPDVGGIRGHGVAWGDARGTGYPDLFVASFHNEGSKPGMLFRNDKGKFTLDPQEQLRTSGMGSGALFVDLTNNGKLDLYVSTCATGKGEARDIPSRLFRNDGEGKFTDVSQDSGMQLPNFAGRGLAAGDIDGDGKLDLILPERYYGKVTHGPAYLRNLGNYKFANDSEKAGLPAKLSCLSVGVADLNNDGWPDLFISEGDGNHHLYLNDRQGKFTEVEAARATFQMKGLGREDTVAGVCVADVNGDGLPDIVIGNHFKAPWQKPAPLRLYLHKGIKDGVPSFEEVTDKVGLKPLAMKAPHVEIQDFDNDGLPDIYTSIVKFKDGQPHPVIYRNLGTKDGMPRFEEYAWAMNDFPNAADLATKGSGGLFDKINKDRSIVYSAAAPTCDFNRDGKIDIFLAHWWVDQPSLLLKNETPGGHWLDVVVEGSNGVNRMGIGSKVKVFPAGKPTVLGSREIAIGVGYCSGQEAVAHFGLGNETEVDVEVTLPHGKGTLMKKGVKADQRIVVK